MAAKNIFETLTITAEIDMKYGGILEAYRGRAANALTAALKDLYIQFELLKKTND